MSLQSQTKKPSVAIIGGGVAGLAAARRLLAEGLRVQVFDKGRGAGGRASTRRVEGLRFDHGAQYFTARDPRFAAQVDAWLESGVVARWDGRIVSLEEPTTREKEDQPDRFVGVPTMNAIVKALGRNVDLRFGIRVTAVEKRSTGWLLYDSQGSEHSDFDVLLLSLPPEQSETLLTKAAPSLASECAAIRSDACWSVFASFSRPLPIDFDGAFVHGSPLAWIARDSSKPGRAPGERWVLQASAEWSSTHLEDPATRVTDDLLSAFFEKTGATPRTPQLVNAHRWRFAKVETSLGGGCRWDKKISVGVFGDWLYKSRIEGAYLSGLSMAETLVAAHIG